MKSSIELQATKGVVSTHNHPINQIKGIGMSEQNFATSSDTSPLVELTHWGVITASGVDAANFLHNQLSNDIVSLGEAQVHLAAFCNVKGRMQASMVAMRLNTHDIALVLHKDLLEKTLKRLSMFVMRAKCTLVDASDAYKVLGCVRSSNHLPAWQRHTMQVNGVSSSLFTWPASHKDQACVVLYPQHGASHAQAEGGTIAADAPALAAWHHAYVASGVTLVSEATFEAFVPQMLNYESVGGVNFKKGCYPGQEVVARSQFRGAIKRRAMLGELNAGETGGVPGAGDEVFANTTEAPDVFEACGVVASVATRDATTVLCFSGQSAAVQAATELRLACSEGSQGYAMQLIDVPYALLTDI
jgi:folate-binding protein YgfZ